MMSLLRRSPALRISLVYLLLACLWVIFSDRLLTVYAVSYTHLTLPTIYSV